MSLNPKIKSVFENLKPHDFIPGRQVSKETVTDDGEKKPIIELQPSSDNTKLILKFIRSKKPEYTLDDLMAGFFCYAKDNGFRRVGLEDDALFPDGDCKFRALTFRVFQNKKSIYDKFGYKPKIDIKEHLSIINNLSLVDGLEILFNLRGMKSLYEKALGFGEGASFSDFILSLDCKTRREFLNRLDELAYKLTTNESSYSQINSSNKTFLKTYRQYVKAHEEMTAVPDCHSGRSSSSSSRSPARSRSASRSRSVSRTRLGSKKRKSRSSSRTRLGSKKRKSRSRGSRGSRRKLRKRK